MAVNHTHNTLHGAPYFCKPNNSIVLAFPSCPASCCFMEGFFYHPEVIHSCSGNEERKNTKRKWSRLWWRKRSHVMLLLCRSRLGVCTVHVVESLWCIVGLWFNTLCIWSSIVLGWLSALNGVFMYRQGWIFIKSHLEKSQGFNYCTRDLYMWVLAVPVSCSNYCSLSMCID